MAVQIGDDKQYLIEEIGNIETTVKDSAEAFLKCSDNVTVIFNENFEKFQKAVQACTAV